MALVASGVGAIHLGVRRDEPPWRQPVGRMPQIDPDQDAALRRLRAAFGFVEVLEVVDHRYARRRTAQGKTSKEVIRCRKRYVARKVFAALHQTDGQNLTTAA